MVLMPRTRRGLGKGRGKGYIEGLKGWKGYKRKELLNGKFRPIFGRVKKYSSKKISGGEFQKRLKKDNVRVLATKKNILKQIQFNERYGSYSHIKGAKLDRKKFLNG